MKRSAIRSMAVGVAAVVAFAGVEARAQSTIPSQVLSGGVAPIANAAAAGARSPGQMVSNSLGRLQLYEASPYRSFSDITETATPGFGETFKLQAATVLVTQLTVAIDLFVQAWLERAGLTGSNPPTNPDNGGRNPGGRKAQSRSASD